MSFPKESASITNGGLMMTATGRNIVFSACMFSLTHGRVGGLSVGISQNAGKRIVATDEHE
jgi:hypothetical protein